jgi:hypothetical protein
MSSDAPSPVPATAAVVPASSPEPAPASEPHPVQYEKLDHSWNDAALYGTRVTPREPRDTTTLSRELVVVKGKLFKRDAIIKELRDSSETLVAAHQTSINAIRATHKDDIETLRAAHQDGFDTVRASLREEVSAITSANQDGIKTLTAAHQGDLNALTTAHQGGINTLAAAHHDDIGVLTSAHQSYVDTLAQSLTSQQTAFDQQLREQRLEVAQSRDSFVERENVHLAKIAKLEDECKKQAKDIANLKAAADASAPAAVSWEMFNMLSGQVTAADNRTKAADARNDALEQKLHLLEAELAQKDATIRNQQSIIAEKDNVITDMDKALDEIKQRAALGALKRRRVGDVDPQANLGVDDDVLPPPPSSPTTLSAPASPVASSAHGHRSPHPQLH